jgi:predicted glutamine amidotransferase
MCIIAIQPMGVKIKENILKNCWDANNDGAGIMYVENGKVIVNREMHSFSDFMKLKRNADKLNTNIVIHFRIATSGGINERNCHPFKVNNDVYFCHNGILDIEVPNNSNINDTQIFNNAFMKGLPNDFVKNTAIMQLLEYSIGNRNKFVFLDSNGQFYILNENAGRWDSGAWFSNDSYKTRPYYSYYKPNKKWQKDAFSEIDNELIDSGELIMCESCNEIHSAEDIVHDKYFDLMLCQTCNEYCMDEK